MFGKKQQQKKEYNSQASNNKTLSSTARQTRYYIYFNIFQINSKLNNLKFNVTNENKKRFYLMKLTTDTKIRVKTNRSFYLFPVSRHDDVI